MIYEALSLQELNSVFYRYQRQDQFSYEGRKALYDFLDSLGDDIELDVIALCCDYSEHTESELQAKYNREKNIAPLRIFFNT